MNNENQNPLLAPYFDILEERRLSGAFTQLGLANTDTEKTLSFVDTRSFLPRALENKSISFLVISEDIADDFSGTEPHCECILVSDARAVFYQYHNYLANIKNLGGPKTIIGHGCMVAESAQIAENSVVIGNNVTIEPNVTILPGVKIGDGCVLRAGAVIGVEGFEHKRLADNTILSVVHDGHAILGEYVEVGGNSTVAKGFMGKDTTIGDYTKIDCLVHIGHCVSIGKRCLLPSMIIFSGSVSIGDDVWIGPNVTLSSSINVGDNAFVTLGSVVVRDVAPSARVTGNFAIDHSEFKRKMQQ